MFLDSQAGAGAVEPVTASKGLGAGVEEPVAGAGQPSGRAPLSVVLEAVQAQVPQSAERDRVLDAGRHLASGFETEGCAIVGRQMGRTAESLSGKHMHD